MTLKGGRLFHFKRMKRNYAVRSTYLNCASAPKLLIISKKLIRRRLKINAQRNFVSKCLNKHNFYHITMNASTMKLSIIYSYWQPLSFGCVGHINAEESFKVKLCVNLLLPRKLSKKYALRYVWSMWEYDLWRGLLNGGISSWQRLLLLLLP